MMEVNSRLRGFILDSQITDGHEVSILLGCSAISDEVAEHEEQESDKRLEKISYLIPLIYSYAHLLAEGSVEYQKKNMPEELKDISNDLWDTSRRMMEEIVFSALSGAISQLIDMKLITVPRRIK
jgi:hypothetical protein